MIILFMLSLSTTNYLIMKCKCELLRRGASGCRVSTRRSACLPASSQATCCMLTQCLVWVELVHALDLTVVVITPHPAPLHLPLLILLPWTCSLVVPWTPA